MSCSVRNHKARTFLISLGRPGNNYWLKLLSIFRNEWAGRHEEKCYIVEWVAASRRFVEKWSEFVGTYRLVLALALLFEVLQAVSLRVALWKVFIYIYKPWKRTLSTYCSHKMLTKIVLYTSSFDVILSLSCIFIIMSFLNKTIAIALIFIHNYTVDFFFIPAREKTNHKKSWIFMSNHYYTVTLIRSFKLLFYCYI